MQLFIFYVRLAIALKAHLSKYYTKHNYVRPILEFGSVIWSPWVVKDKNLLEGVQRKFTKKKSYINKQALQGTTSRIRPTWLGGMT
jgi:hypothetical protein